MKIRIFFFLASVVLVLPLSAQFKSFAWSDSVDGDWQGTKVKTSVDTWVVFVGNYMDKTICDFTYHWKCSSESWLMEYKQNSFQPIEEEEMFKDGGKELLTIINEKIQQCYNQGLGGVHDCFVGMDRPTNVTWGSVGISFSDDGMYIGYGFDSGSYCDAYNGCDTLIGWDKIKPMLKNSIEVTPNFCTPSGPKVNVRADQNAKAEVLFQLDKGQFFEILETGKTDKVNGKSGSWYKINFEGKSGYIFSFYTLCK